MSVPPASLPVLAGGAASRASGGRNGLRQHLVREGSGLCGMQHGRSWFRPATVSRTAPGHGDSAAALPVCRARLSSRAYCPAAPFTSPARFPCQVVAFPLCLSAACASAVHPECRGRLSIAYQITGDQLQVTIEVACHTDRTQVLTTIGWADCIDDVSRGVLTNALRAAADECCPVRIHAFAVAARDLFKHVSRTLAARPWRRSRHRAGHPARHGSAGPCNAETDALHGGLPAAIDDLRNACRLRPRLTITDRAEADRFIHEALSALQLLYASFGSYLEHALRPLEPHVSREAVRAFVLETRGEVDELAACHTVGDVYVESLTITEPGDNAIILEVEASLGNAGP